MLYHQIDARYRHASIRPRAPLQRVEVNRVRPWRRCPYAFRSFPCKSTQNNEPTSGLEPLTCSLRVIIHALQGVAHSCESRISKPLSLLRFARCCTVLRSRWCQSGVNIVLCIRVTQSSTLVPFGAHRASLTSCDRPVNLCPRLMHLAIRHRLGTDGPTSPP
jgi:hypothetical protein